MYDDVIIVSELYGYWAVLQQVASHYNRANDVAFLCKRMHLCYFSILDFMPSPITRKYYGDIYFCNHFKICYLNIGSFFVSLILILDSNVELFQY